MSVLPKIRAAKRADIDFICREIRRDWSTIRPGLTRRIEKMYRENGVTMRVDPNDQQFFLSALYTVVRTIRAAHIVETGTFVGCSAVAMACAMEDYGLPGRVETIDPAPRNYGGLDVDDPVSIARRVFNNSFPGRVIFHHGYSVRPWDTGRHDRPASPQGVLVDLVSQGKMSDLLLIDGDHTYQGAFWDLEVGSRLLDPHGARIIFVHDYHSIAAVKKAVRDWRNRYRGQLLFRAWAKQSGFAILQCSPAIVMKFRQRRSTSLPT